MSDTYLRDVVRAFESTGPKGGRELVHVLSCGCWVINRRRTPAKKLRCIACRVREEQAGDGRHGAPRVEDIAWQAFQAGVRHASGTLPCSDNWDRLKSAFGAWWAKR